MFYQALIDDGHYVEIFDLAIISSHWHSELEILYCIKGSFEIMIDGCNFSVQTGNTVFIGSAEAHECINIEPGTKVLLIEMGEIFLKKNFKYLVNRTFTQPVVADIPDRIQYSFDTIKTCFNHPDAADSEWNTMSCLFNLAVYMFRELPGKHEISNQRIERIRAIQNVSEVIEYINENYMLKITVDDVVKQIKYGVAYFHRLFKKATQMTFYQYLNRFRINKACSILNVSNESIKSIALKTGFSEAKTFCRVFKNIMKKTPGEYRRSVLHEK
jgi:AraC-like DNA-binding protein